MKVGKTIIIKTSEPNTIIGGAPILRKEVYEIMAIVDNAICLRPTFIQNSDRIPLIWVDKRPIEKELENKQKEEKGA